MSNLQRNAALMLVDVQQGFLNDPAYFGGERNNPQAEVNMQRLLYAWRDSQRPVIVVKHNSTNTQSPLRPGQPGNALQYGFTPLPNDIYIEKTVNSAFIGTNLEATLRRIGIQQLVIAGLTTNHCVSTTTRMAGNLGFETFLVADATATFALSFEGEVFSAQTLHATALASLHNEFATVCSTAALLKRVDGS
jgi:nicotinamidase-related amidase